MADKPSYEELEQRTKDLEKEVLELERPTSQNKLMLRISQALHEHNDLESLLNYITSEVKKLLETEAAVVLLLDHKTQELYFIASAHEDPEIGRRVKEIRFSLDQLASGKVIETGEPLIHYETSHTPLYPERDKILGYASRNLISVPLRAEGRIIGVLNAVNKIEGTFGSRDVDLLNMVAGTVALSIENARVSEELKRAYQEVSSLNTAKDRTIKHLSHELKTPLQTLSLSIDILKDVLKQVPERVWNRPMELSKKSLKRIIAIQEEAADIMQDRQYRSYGLISLMFEQCSDVLAGLFAGKCGDGRLFEHVKDRIEEAFGLRRAEPEIILFDEFIQARIETSQKWFAHRQIDLDCILGSELVLFLPKDILEKVIDGLIRNAVENTPDEGRIEIRAGKEGGRIEFSVHDFGIGIAEEHKENIFQGYLPTQDLMRYSSKSPYDFYAGGKGADLLRMKIFSEKYHFNISMESQYCPHIEQSQEGVCPGVISKCSACKEREDCLSSSGTRFTLSFQESKIPSN
jgi:signal transduction histidine kinase